MASEEIFKKKKNNKFMFIKNKKNLKKEN